MHRAASALSLPALALRPADTVYASMRETEGRNAPQVAEVAAFAKENGADLKAVELDVASDASVEAGIAERYRAGRPYRRHHPQCRAHVLRSGGSLHAGTVRPALRHQRLEHAAHQPRSASPSAQAGEGLVVWVSSSSTAAARRRTSRPISPPRLPWIRSPSPTPPN